MILPIIVETCPLGAVAERGVAPQGGDRAPRRDLDGGGRPRSFSGCKRLPLPPPRSQLAISRKRRSRAADPALCERPHLRDALRSRSLLPRRRRSRDRRVPPGAAAPGRLVP